METLPDEMLLHLFRYFTTYELSSVLTKVSLRWRHLINRTVLRIRKAVDLDKLYDGLRAVIVTERVLLLDDSSTLVSCFIMLAPQLQELTICRDYPLDDEDYRYLIYLQHLTHLDVFSKKKCVDKNTFISPSITSLVINDPVGEGFLTNVAQSNQLRAFHLFGRCQFFTIKEMMNFLQVQAPYLQDLTLRCPELTDERYRKIGQCLELVNLQLHTCALLTKNGATYFQNLTNLRRLHLTGTTKLRSRGLHHLIVSLPRQIEQLNLSCSQFGEEHCGTLAARLPALRSLELWRTGVGGDALLRLVCHLPVLRALDTDVELCAPHLRGLANHRALRRLRCRRRRQHQRPRVAGVARSACITTCARECLRGDDEGPSAEHYYYWTRGVVLRSLTSPNPDSAHDQIIVDAEDYSEDNLDLLDGDDELDDNVWAGGVERQPPEHVPLHLMLRSDAPSWAVVYVRRAGEAVGLRGYTYVLEDVACNTTLIHKVFNKGGLYCQEYKQRLPKENLDDQEDVVLVEDEDEFDDAAWGAAPSPSPSRSPSLSHLPLPVLEHFQEPSPAPSPLLAGHLAQWQWAWCACVRSCASRVWGLCSRVYRSV